MLKNDFKTIYGIILKNDFFSLDQYINSYGINNIESNVDHRTLLMFATIEKNLEVTKYLINKGANVNIKDKSGFTALHFAVFEDNLSIVQLLVDSGCNIDSLDDQGNTALWRSVMLTDGNSPISKFLISKGADIKKENLHGVSPEDIM